MTKRSLLAAAALTAALLASGAASANVYSFVGGGFDALISTSNALDAAGGYDITGISGTLANWGAITGLVTNPNQPWVWTDQNPPLSGGANLTIDNVWYASDPHLDGNGLAFLLSNGMTGAIWGGGFWGGSAPGQYSAFLGAWNFTETFQAKTAPAAPEPATLALLGLGLAGLGLAGRRKARTARAIEV